MEVMKNLLEREVFRLFQFLNDPKNVGSILERVSTNRSE